jgi:hypothetical protein
MAVASAWSVPLVAGGKPSVVLTATRKTAAYQPRWLNWPPAALTACTMNTYSHVLPNMQDESAKMGALVD